MTKALLVAGIILILGVAGLAGALLGGALMIGTQPPYLITSGTSPFDVVTPPLYGVAYVYPNGSYILLMWVFNPITINVSNTHVWILVPPFAVWKQEVPPNYPLPQCINITNKPLPPWWGQRALECFR